MPIDGGPASDAVSALTEPLNAVLPAPSTHLMLHSVTRPLSGPTANGAFGCAVNVPVKTLSSYV